MNTTASPASLEAAKLKGSVLRVSQALEAAGVDATVRRFPEGTRSAADAAAAVGCEVAQIAKSLVFRTVFDERPVLVIASGVNRVDPARVAALLEREVTGADGRWVRQRTGFAIGGVAPVGHLEPPLSVIDEDLFRWPELWAAAGAPDAVFPIAPDRLLAITGALRGAVREG